jgi:hypothetical protein
VNARERVVHHAANVLDGLDAREGRMRGTRDALRAILRRELLFALLIGDRDGYADGDPLPADLGAIAALFRTVADEVPEDEFRLALWAAVEDVVAKGLIEIIDGELVPTAAFEVDIAMLALAAEDSAHER